MKKNILIVEDEESIVNFIKNRLEKNLYNIDVALDGKDALSKLQKNEYDLVTLDVMIPHVDGFTLCNVIRNISKKTLIIIISALNTDDFKAKGYDCGIDDYISKPFSAKELSIKIKSLLNRRDELSLAPSVQNEFLHINDDSKEIFIKGICVDFTPSEYFLISVLFGNKNRVYSRQELAQLIYDNYLGRIDDRGIDSHICNIRKKISKFDNKDIIKTVRGIGYKVNEY